MLVGITGGIGAGKSIVSRIFEVLGIAKYDADTQAKWLMNNDVTLKLKIKTLFGEQAYSHNELNRAYIASQVFDNKPLLNQLNNIVHPAVAADFASWTAQQSSPYVLKEAALLFEAGSYKLLNKIITVTAPESIRISRVKNRDGRSEEQIRSIITNQMKEDEKVAKSNYVIMNDDSHLVIEQVLSIHHSILEEISG